MTVQDQSIETPDDAPVPMHEGDRNRPPEVAIVAARPAALIVEIPRYRSHDFTFEYNALSVFPAFCIITRRPLTGPLTQSGMFDNISAVRNQSP